MNHTQFCLSKEVLDRIGHDEVLPDELRAIEDHVSQCEHCRDLFAEATVERAWAETILPVLRDRSCDLSRTGNEACNHEADHWIGNEATLRLLGPTDDPRMLGRIGPYEVTGIIGRGGMGVVFKAFDAALNRFVAIKMLLPHLASSGSARKRFSREGQAAAAVIDDHVLPIYGVDEWQGVPYIVTQYSSGTSLQKRIHEQGPLELKEILRISLQTARGLAAAHAQGLVHRDVKPSNILLDRTVERALLTDFGLARAVDDATITRSGTIAGTPQFMAPEQARGEAVDGRSDLFSLGSVMYAMCTGHPPFRAETSYGVLRRITDDEPRPIREVNSDVPDWLCGIVAKLMAKQPEDRFASASEVAELLEKCLAHLQQPATVPLPHSVIAATPAANRNRRPPMAKLIGAAAFAFALLFAGVLIVLELNKGELRIQCNTDDVPIRIMKGDELVQKLTVTRSGKTVRIAAGQYVVELDGEIDGIEVEGGTVSLKRRGEETVKIVQTVAANHAGEDSHLAGDQIGTVLGTHVFERDLNKNVELREALVQLFVRPIEIHYLKQQGLDPEDEVKRRIAGEGGQAAALMFVRQRVLHEHLFRQRGGRVQLTKFGPIAYDAHRKWLAECEEAGLFELLRAEHRNLLFEPLNDALQARLTEDPDIIRQAFDPEFINEIIRMVAAIPIEPPAPDPPTIAPANARTGVFRFRIQPESRVSVLAWSPDASTLAVGGDRGIVSLYDGQTGKQVTTLKLLTDEELARLDAVNLGSYAAIGALAFSNDSTMLAVGSGLGQLKLFNVRSGELIRAFDDDRAKLAETENPEILKSLERGLGSAGSLAFSPDGSLLATSGRSFADFTRFAVPVERRLGERSTGPGRLKVWAVGTGTLQHDLDGHSDANMVAFSADGSLLASAGRWLDKSDAGDGVIVWNPQSGEKLRVLSQEANGGTHAVAFSPDGNKVVIASRHFDNENDTSTTTVRLAHPLSGITAWQQTVEGWAKPKGFLPDGKSVAVLSAGKLIRLMDAETGAVKNEIQSADFPADSPLQGGRWIDIAISPDGTQLAIGGVASTNLSFVEVLEISRVDMGQNKVSSDPGTLDAINRQLAGLNQNVHHDFAVDGSLGDLFVVRGGDDAGEHIDAKPDGLHVTHRGKDGYSNTYVETLKRIHGNFEVTVSFKDLTVEPGENGSGGISLTAILANDVHTHGTVHRGATVDHVTPIWNFVQGEFVHGPQRDPGVVWLGTTAEEATSGRIRLARVGATLYCLFAANDSPEFRLIHAEQVGPEDLLYGGIRLITQVQSNGSTRGTTSVIWKDITIRAERITDWPVADSVER